MIGDVSTVGTLGPKELVTIRSLAENRSCVDTCALTPEHSLFHSGPRPAAGLFNVGRQTGKSASVSLSCETRCGLETDLAQFGRHECQRCRKGSHGDCTHKPSIDGLLATVETGRRNHPRMLTCTLNKTTRTPLIALLLSVGSRLTGVFVTTPRLIRLLLFANDFVTIPLSADRVTFSSTANR